MNNDSLFLPKNINSTMKNDDVTTENTPKPSSSNPSVHLFLCRLLQEPRNNGGQDQRAMAAATTATADNDNDNDNDNDTVVSVDTEKMIRCEIEWSHSLSQIDDDISADSALPSLHSMLTQEIIEPTLSLLLPPSSSSSKSNSNATDTAAAITNSHANSNSYSYSYSLHGYKHPTLTFQILATIRMAVILLHHNQTQCAAVALTRLTQCITNSIHIAENSKLKSNSNLNSNENAKKEDKIQVHEHEHDVHHGVTVPVRLFLHLCLRILEPLCSTRRGANQCCAVTWRGITTIATTLSSTVSSTESSTNTDVAHYGTSIDEEIVKRAISRLVHLLAEGWEGIRTMNPPPEPTPVVPIRNHNNSQQDEHHHKQMQMQMQMQMQRYKMELGNRNKLLKFFAMRLVQLSPLLSASSPSSSSSPAPSSSSLVGALEGDSREEEADADAEITVQDILESLITLRGSVAYTEIEQQRTPGIGIGIDTKSMKGLSSKLDECLESFMLRLCDRALHHDTINAFLTCCTRIHSEKKRNGRRRNDVHLHLGALICAMHILEKAVEQTQTQTLVHEGVPVGEDDAQYLLALCELILFHIVPHCHAHLVSASMKNTTTSTNESANINAAIGLDRILKVILKTLLRIHVQPHVMIRWLAGNVHASDASTSSTMTTTSTLTLVHPLTIELVMGIAHTYIVRCRRKRLKNDGVSEIIGGGGVGKHHHRNRNGLIRIMSKMVFDPRTSRIHRRHMGIVLHRLLKMTERGKGSNKINGKGMAKRKSSVREIKHTVEAAVARAYLDFLEGQLIQSTGTYQNYIKENQQGGTESGIGNERTTGKRKRSGAGADIGKIGDNRSNCKRYPTVEGLCEILPLIRTISTSPIVWSKMSTSTYEALMTMMSNLLSFQCVSSRGNDNDTVNSNVDACKSGRMDKNSTKRRSKSRGGRRRNALSSQLAKIQLLLRDNPDLFQVAVTFLSAASTTGASASTSATATSDSNSTKSQSLTSREQHQQLLEIMTLALSQVHTQKVTGAFRDHNLALYRLAKDLISSTSTTAKGGPSEQLQILTPKILEYLTTTLKALTSSRKSLMSQTCGCAILLSGMSTVIATLAANPNHALSQGITSAITSSFNFLLSNRNTSIVAMAMSSLEEFAKKVSDRRMIPGCVPPKSQSLLQARLKYEIYCASSRRSIMVPPERIFYWRSQEGEKLVMSSKTNRQFFPGLLLPSTKSLISFEVGARILQINDPSDKTKRAFIIIPPPNHNGVNLTDLSTWEIGKDGRIMRVDSSRRGRRCNISTG